MRSGTWFRPVLRVLLAALAAMTAPVFAAAATLVPGTRVSLDPPPGFTPAERFPGFERADAGASVMVTEMPAPVAQVSAGMTLEGLAKGGMILLTSTPATVSGRDATLIHVAQVVQGAPFEKWIAVFGDGSQTIMVVGTYPRTMADSLSEPVRLSVLSARWDETREVDFFEGLRFRVSETATLKFARRVSNMVLLTKDGTPGKVAPEDPLAVVGTSISQSEIADLETFSRRRLAQTAEITELANIEGRALTVDGLPAFELEADANDRQTGLPLRLYQLVVAEGRDYVLVQGLVGRAQASRFLPEFRQISSSLTRSD